jgi:hypothetical protein
MREPDVSEEHIASIFRVKEQKSAEFAALLLVSCMAYLSVLKMEAVCSSGLSQNYMTIIFIVTAMRCMYVRGGPYRPAPAPRPSTIYCANSHEILRSKNIFDLHL